MRKLTLAASVALTGAALALPSTASADTADAAAGPPCPTVVHCAHYAISRGIETFQYAVYTVYRLIP